MPIKFNTDRWEKVKSDSRLWWEGKLGRPLIHLSSGGRDPGRREPRLKGIGFSTPYDLSIPAEDIVDRWDYELSTLEFHGDSFPSVWPNFGPGVLAAFIGGVPKPASDTVWFHPSRDMELEDLRMSYDANNVWFQRVKDIYRIAAQRWQGQVQLGMTDLGGNLDILATFRPGEQSIMDLYDHPDEVKRQTWNVHHLWWRHFEELNSILKPTNPGHTAWAPIFSEEPYYMLQCDFCYMISPDMFDEFVKPELEASCKRLRNAFYHLDGIGQLSHLDSLLSIKELKGVQWIPGDGQPDMTKWPEVYRKIRAAGKLIQIWGNLRTVDTLVSQIGSADGILCISEGDPANEAEARELLRKYGGA